MRSTKMLWLIQENFYTSENLFRLETTLQNFNISYKIVNAHTIIEHISYNVNIIACGGNSINKISNQFNWKSKVFYSEFDFEILLEKYGDYLLNANCIITDTEHIPMFEGSKFIRPTKDNKFFNGGVFTRNEFQEIIDTTNKTEIIISDEQDIIEEVRFFIIDGEIVSQSRYKFHGMISISKYVLKEAVDFIEKVLEIWKPTDGFVVDIALTNNGYKIIEFNNLLSSSLYATDITKIITKVQDYFTKRD